MTSGNINDFSLEILEKIKTLLDEGYGNVRRQVKEKMTVGEFIKMVDLYKKLVPKESGYKEFWDMLDKIRKESLSNNGQKKTNKTGNRKQKKVKAR